MAYRFPEKIFPNTISAYIQCPFRFKCRNDEEIRAEFVDTPENFVGKAIHSALNDFFDILKIPIDERKNQDIGKILRLSWARMQKNGWGKDCWNTEERAKLFGSKEQEKAFGLQAIAILQNYISNADLSVIPLSLEDWMDCSIGGFKIAGRIDRIDQDSESSISVWDYKTGKLPFHDSVEKMMGEDLQLPIYAIIASMLNPFAEKVRAGLIFIKYSRVYDITWTKNQLKEIEDKVVAVIKRANEDKEFLPRANKLCPWCEYMKACPVKNSIQIKDQKVEEVSW